MTPPSFYITTAIDYVNAPPHLGHAYEKIATDVAARFHRLKGENVFFLTGTDEHGGKVQKTAEAKGQGPKAYADDIAARFQATWQMLNLSYDRFIRTTDADHYVLVAKLWQTLMAKDAIYKNRYQGHYCSGCENFLTARDLAVDGTCSIHKVAPELVEEENYFFRLSQYKDRLRQHIEQHPGFIQPEFRVQEVLNVLTDLEDISVSRARASVDWGIPVPGDDSQTIYVWIDALSNYLTGAGEWTDAGYQSGRWPASCHMIGKDILRFHAIYWTTILMAAELPLPHTIFAHGFININDTKISKSLGNVVAPADVMDEFQLTSPDALRYYLMVVAAFGQDGNFTSDDFKTRVNADLANNLGNLLNRALSMTQKYFNGVVPQAQQWLLDNTLTAALVQRVDETYQQYAFQTAIELTLQWVDQANRLINQTEPWNLFKNNHLEDLANVMYTVLDTLRMVSIMLSPVIPEFSAEIWRQLGQTQPFETVQWEAINNRLAFGQALQPGPPLFLRLDSEIAGASKKVAVH